MSRLIDELDNYLSRKVVPLHMPGHKRLVEQTDYLARLGARYDFTEADGLDDLHDPKGIIAAAQERAARAYGADYARISVNGATGAILAAVSALVGRGDEVVLSRACHRSVYNALLTVGAVPVFIDPPTRFGIPLSITPQAVESALTPRTRLVILTSPTYEGVLSDISGIAAVVHSHGARLFVDGAHGAHLDRAVFEGADAFVVSLHKMLPALNQTALLLWNGDGIGRVSRMLSVFQTSSPSYILMASADGAVDLLEQQGDSLRARARERIENFIAHTSHPIFNGGEGVFAFDEHKLVLLSANGYALRDGLRTHGIECESAAVSYALGLTGLLDESDILDRLARALALIEPSAPVECGQVLPQGESVLPMSEAWQLESAEVPLEQAAGHISGGFVWLYPPGIPLLIPGQRITPSIAETEFLRTDAEKEGYVRILKENS